MTSQNIHLQAQQWGYFYWLNAFSVHFDTCVCVRACIYKCVWCMYIMNGVIFLGQLRCTDTKRFHFNSCHYWVATFIVQLIIRHTLSAKRWISIFSVWTQQNYILIKFQRLSNNRQSLLLLLSFTKTLRVISGGCCCPARLCAVSLIYLKKYVSPMLSACFVCLVHRYVRKAPSSWMLPSY